MMLDRKAVYCLVDVQDHQGNSRVSSRKLYQERVGCLATNLCWDGESVRMEFVKDPEGNWIRRPLHTSTVQELTGTERGLTIRTRNSVYLLESLGEDVLNQSPDEYPAGMVEDGYHGELLELYLSEEGNHFCRGIYWDRNETTHLLRSVNHMGMLVDTCLIYGAEEGGNMCFFCSYYLHEPERIEFYNTIYGQRDYSRPMLIRNCGKIALRICFEGSRSEWTVEPGGCAFIRLDLQNRS